MRMSPKVRVWPPFSKEQVNLSALGIVVPVSSPGAWQSGLETGTTIRLVSSLAVSIRGRRHIEIPLMSREMHMTRSTAGPNKLCRRTIFRPRPANYRKTEIVFCPQVHLKKGSERRVLHACILFPSRALSQVNFKSVARTQRG
jgi:hypothetical protein